MADRESDGRHAPLSLDRDAMRRLGYDVVDYLVDHFATLADQPVAPTTDVEALKAALARPFRDGPADPAEVLDEVRTRVFGNALKVGHPRFFGYIPTPSNFVSAMADALASGINVFAGVGTTNAGPTLIEQETIRWLCDLAGLPDGSGGLFQTGGSGANLTGLCVARGVRLGGVWGRAVVYSGEQTHACVRTALKVLGLPRDSLRLVPDDATFRMDTAALTESIEADLAAGLQPFCLAVSAGTTNTGAIDPLPDLADLADRHGLWLHVDAAYGGAALLCEEGRGKLAGIERADTVVIDGHKWLFQAIECSTLLVRDRDWLAHTFRTVPAYMKDNDTDPDGLPNYRDLGIQTTRAFRALKLWMSLKVFGVGAFRRAVEQGLELARHAERLIGARDRWHMAAPVSLGVAVFRYAHPDLDPDANDRLNAAMCAALVADGLALVSSSVLDGRKVIRLCPIHPATTRADVEHTIDRLEQLAEACLPKAHATG